jgi:hypothetical protein
VKLDTLLFLEESDAIVAWLKKMHGINLRRISCGYCLACRLSSSEAYYPCVKVLYATQDEPKACVSLMIPHALVKFLVQSERERVLGFVNGTHPTRRMT